MRSVEPRGLEPLTPCLQTALTVAAMAIYQHATLDRDKRLADAIGDSYARWAGAHDRT